MTFCRANGRALRRRSLLPRRSSEPAGARRETGQALAQDLGDRLPHHWLAAGGQERSTIDLIGDGLTLLAGPADPRWARFADTEPPKPPVTLHVIDASTADALDLPPAGALVARPDGRELRRWTSLDTALTGVSPWCAG